MDAGEIHSLLLSQILSLFQFHHRILILNMDSDSTQFKVGGTSAEKVTVLKPKNEKC